MKPTLMGVVLAGVLCTGCSTTLTDPATPQDGTGNPSENSSQPSLKSAPSIQPDDLADTEDASVRANSRGSAHSLHPSYGASQGSADTPTEALRATGD